MFSYHHQKQNKTKQKKLNSISHKKKQQKKATNILNYHFNVESCWNLFNNLINNYY
jgi:hypothetical protein